MKHRLFAAAAALAIPSPLAAAPILPRPPAHFGPATATYLGLQDRIGSIAAGKDADLFIVNGNPAANINDVENVIVVFKDGVGYDSAKLIHSVKGRFGEY